jgi:hypothetical protein
MSLLIALLALFSTLLAFPAMYFYDEWATFTGGKRAVLGILVVGLGFPAFCLLVTKMCFALKSTRLEQVLLCQFLCVLSSVVTLLLMQYKEPYQVTGEWNQVAKGRGAGFIMEDTGVRFMIVAVLLHFLGFLVTFVKEEKDETMVSATNKETLALTTGQAVGEEPTMPSGANGFAPPIEKFDS